MKNNYIIRIISIIITCVLLAVVLVVINYNFFLNYDARENTPLSITQLSSLSTSASRLNDNAVSSYYIMYNTNDVQSQLLADNFVSALTAMKQPYRLVSIENSDVSNINSRDTIILALYEWKNCTVLLNSILLKVSTGTQLLVPYLPISDPVFKQLSRKFGIFETGGNQLCDSYHFLTDAIIGLEGNTLTAPILACSIAVVHTVDTANTIIETNNHLPIYYTISHGAGSIGVYTSDNLFDIQHRGLISGLLSTLSPQLIYPVIQSGVLFIDDFPSPMNGYSKIINQDISSFVRNVWWPDVLAFSKQYQMPFTAAILFDYNGDVTPPYTNESSLQTNMIYYYGKEILRSGGEICLHGYNHQPLKFNSYFDAKLSEEYTQWPSIAVATQVLDKAFNKFAEPFPSYSLHGYVPPSNVITVEGENILKDTFNSKPILCSLYTSSEPDIPRYDFGMDDEIIYFPRIESGCFLTDDVKYSVSTTLTHLGVFSHFIHPDDILRSEGKTWPELRLGLKEMFSYLQDEHSYLRKETLTNAAIHTADWSQIEMKTNYYDDYLLVHTNQTQKSYYLMLRTTKQLKPSPDYTSEKISSSAYMIHAKKDFFKIEFADSKENY